jgi:guanine deaminase
LATSYSRVPRSAIRGPVLSFKGDPVQDGPESTMAYESDAIVAFGDGQIAALRPFDRIRPPLPADIAAILPTVDGATIVALSNSGHIAAPQ